MKASAYIGPPLFFALAAMIIVASFQIMQPRFIHAGLDASWVAAMLEVRHLNLRFGEDIIFTMGPLSSAYSSGFAPNLFYGQLSVILVITFYLSAFVAVVSAHARNVVAFCLAVTPFIFVFSRDAVLMSVPLCAALLATVPSDGRRYRWLAIAGASVAAGAALVKFSTFPVAVAGFLIIDILAVSRRRVPLALAVYFTTMAVILWWTSPGASLWLFITHNLDVMIGYGDAMSANGSILEVIAVGITMSALITLVCATEMKGIRSGEVSWLQAGARVIIIALFLFVNAKAGLIRHDLHVLTAWSSAALVAGFYCVFAWSAISRPKIVALVMVTLVCAGAFYHRTGGRVSPGVWISRPVTMGFSELARWPRFIKDPAQWIKDHEKTQQAAMARVRAEQPLPKLEGTVDVIPSMQSTIIANELKYWPRPSVQEYTTFSRPQIEANRAFFRGSRAPDYLLMAPETIDGRYPALAEGPLWPEFLARYLMQDFFDGLAVLRRRDNPVDVPLHVIETKVVAKGEPVSIDSALGPIFAAIDIRPTFAGSLAKLIFKTAQVYMDVEYTDGSQARYRIIPGIAREGFFLSPTIDSGGEYGRLALGLASENPRKVKSFTIAQGAAGRWLWNSHFTVTLSRLDEQALRKANGSNDMPPRFKNSLHLMSILKDNPPHGPALRMVPEGLLAHAPEQLNVPTGGHTTLEISFGIQGGAWQGAGDTKGVCFRVVSKAAPAALWERCLDPKRQAADRGTQSATIAVPPGADEVVLETVCRDGCDWDWSYWGRVAFN